eukprot:scaffold204119_cov26-Tisochrysis_lutea.AAC.4
MPARDGGECIGRRLSQCRVGGPIPHLAANLRRNPCGRRAVPGDHNKGHSRVGHEVFAPWSISTPEEAEGGRLRRRKLVQLFGPHAFDPIAVAAQLGITRRVSKAVEINRANGDTTRLQHPLKESLPTADRDGTNRAAKQQTGEPIRLLRAWCDATAWSCRLRQHREGAFSGVASSGGEAHLPALFAVWLEQLRAASAQPGHGRASSEQQTSERRRGL